MNNKTKAIAAGSIVAILLLVLVYVYFFMGESATPIDPKAMESVDAATDAANANPAPAPDLSNVPASARTPGGKMRPPGN
jgi:Na+-transporting methylmalonyl-CoA/oxaloacetate decarboxylase gamma subunit